MARTLEQSETVIESQPRAVSCRSSSPVPRRAAADATALPDRWFCSFIGRACGEPDDVDPNADLEALCTSYESHHYAPRSNVLHAAGMCLTFKALVDAFRSDLKRVSEPALVTQSLSMMADYFVSDEAVKHPHVVAALEDVFPAILSFMQGDGSVDLMACSKTSTRRGARREASAAVPSLTCMACGAAAIKFNQWWTNRTCMVSNCPDPTGPINRHTPCEESSRPTVNWVS